MDAPLHVKCSLRGGSAGALYRKVKIVIIKIIKDEEGGLKWG